MRRKEFMKRVLTGCLTGALVLSSPLSFLSGGAAAHAKEIYTAHFATAGGKNPDGIISAVDKVVELATA